MEQKQTGKRQRLGKYELLERLGHGGMGEVWKARDTQLQRYVAIKLLRADLQDDADFIAYFMREARLVAALHHPNIVQLHDFQLAGSQDENDHAYMVMDYIEGGTLAGAIHGIKRKGVFWSASEIVDLFTAIGLALDYAHEQGMIHRDIKPANILLDHSLSTSHTLGEPILTDFGIARWQGGGSTVTGFVGTPLYISPEQAQSRPVDARSDLYSLGIVLYEVLTGVTPFRGDNPLGIMLQHVEDQPPLPALINPLISPALSAVVLQSIAKDPRERFPSALAMTKALAQAFNLPTPALLGRSGEGHGSPSAYNPLQPRPGSMFTPAPPVSTPHSGFTPFVGNSPARPLLGAPPVNEMNRVTPGAGDLTRITPTSTFSPGFSPQPQQATGEAQPLAPGTRRQPGNFSRKWLLVVSAICIALLFLGLGGALLVPRFFHTLSTPTTTSDTNSGISGHILFLSSSPGAKSVFNELQIDLSNVPPVPAGQVYYAWLMQADSEASIIPHWPLQESNGTIHDLYTSSSPQLNLLAASNLFLVTAEDASSTPIIPYPLPARHLYYALITHTSSVSPTFAIKSCPTSNVNSATNPCR
ncbi:MAG TPA: protein kinase [Ktedonobacteraceae bacterium]|nr:protein kinase [Ktedonobacteraceae bacterium]